MIDQFLQLMILQLIKTLL